jgi:pimeloyl-ACP methyl ester carboxylesterase
MFARAQALAAAGKFLWPIPDKGLKKRIHRIKTPTLILWGESDKLVPTVYAHEFHERIPGSRLAIVPEAAHMLPVEQAERVADEILRFAREE